MRVAYGNNLPVDPNSLDKRLKAIEAKSIQIPISRGFFKVTKVDELKNDDTLFSKASFNKLYDNNNTADMNSYFVLDGAVNSRVCIFNSFTYKDTNNIRVIRFICYEPTFLNDTGGLQGVTGLYLFEIKMDASGNYSGFVKKPLLTTVMTEASYNSLNTKDKNMIYYTTN